MAVVVVMDDELSVARLIRTVVEAAGHEVYMADSVAAAWTLLDKRPSLMFLDIDLPNETGIDLVMRLRNSPEHSEIPVVFVTAYAERARPLQASGRGAFAVIDKPFSIDEITAVVRRALGDTDHFLASGGSWGAG